MIMEHEKKHSPAKDAEESKAEEKVAAKDDRKNSPIETVETLVEKPRKSKRKKCILKEYRKSIAAAVVVGVRH